MQILDVGSKPTKEWNGGWRWESHLCRVRDTWWKLLNGTQFKIQDLQSNNKTKRKIRRRDQRTLQAWRDRPKFNWKWQIMDHNSKRLRTMDFTCKRLHKDSRGQLITMWYTEETLKADQQDTLTEWEWVAMKWPTSHSTQWRSHFWKMFKSKMLRVKFGKKQQLRTSRAQAKDREVKRSRITWWIVDPEPRDALSDMQENYLEGTRCDWICVQMSSRWNRNILWRGL